MSGELAGEALEQALKEDKKEREMLWADPGTRHAAPRPSAPGVPVALSEPVKFVPQEPFNGEVPMVEDPPPAPNMKPPPNGDLPAGMKMVLWVPVAQGDGTTIYQCSVEGFGFRASASSRRKQRALAYALEDMAKQMIEADANG